MSVAATSSSSSSSSSDRRMMAAELSSSVAAAAMDTESDDGEPKLEIVDEPMAVDVKTEDCVSSVIKSLPPPTSIPVNFVAFRKSVSYDGSSSSINTAAESAVARRMRSIVEETNANEAIESLLMLGRGPVVSPQSREVNVRTWRQFPRRYLFSTSRVSLVPAIELIFYLFSCRAPLLQQQRRLFRVEAAAAG